MKRYLSLLLTAAALLTPAGANALQVPADTAALGYDAIATAQWGGLPCGGQIDVRWEHLGAAINAHSDWYGVPGMPSTYTACSIQFNLDVAWDPAKLCTIDEHERGHLMGHDHDDSVLMNTYYIGPTPECGTAPQKASASSRRRSFTTRWGTGSLLRHHHASNSLELGVQDAQATIEQRDGWATQIGATWERLIVNVGEADAADRIRESHAAGRKVILTVGGNGTLTQHPSVKATLRFIAQLPRVERYTWTNEPDLVGPVPCVYRRRWMQLRRVLGSSLLAGDVSPIKGLGFMKRVAACGHLPRPLPIAVHPYQASDPLAPGKWDMGMGSLPRARRALAKTGTHVDWWLTEFGYGPGWQNRDHIDDRQAAWLWPRAFAMARHVNAQCLIVYTAQGPTWDTRPGEQAWAAIRASF